MSKYIKTLEELENLKLRHGTIMADRLFQMKKVESLEKIIAEIKEILEIHKDNKCAICPKFDECFEHPSCDNVILQIIGGKDNDIKS